MRLAVVDPVYQRELIPGSIPTPMLASLGGGEAYFIPSTDPRSHVPGVWYARQPGYESPDGQYRRVRIAEVPDNYGQIETCDDCGATGDPQSMREHRASIHGEAER